MVGQAFNDKVQGLLIFIPIVIEYKLPANSANLHVSHHNDDDNLGARDYTDVLVEGDHTTLATEIFDQDYVGYKIGINTPPTGPAIEGIDSVDYAVDATTQDIYIEFYYTEDESEQNIHLLMRQLL